MLVDLVCVVKCQCAANGRVEFYNTGRKVEAIEVDGNEPWLKYFNAYPHVAPVEVKVVEPAVIEDFGVADKAAESTDTPTAAEIGAHHKVTIEQLVKKFSPEAMVKMLKEAGMKLASTKWKPATLAKHVQDRGCYIGKM